MRAIRYAAVLLFVVCVGTPMLAQRRLSAPFTGGVLTSALLLPDGSATAPSFAFSSSLVGSAYSGMYYRAADASLRWNVYTPAVDMALNGTGQLTLPSGGAYLFSSGDMSTGPAPDAGFSRAAAGAIKVTNGSTGGGILNLLPVTAPAAPSSGAYLYIDTADSDLKTKSSGGTVLSFGGVYEKFVSGSGVGNTAATTDDPLWTLTSIPAGTLATNGDSVVLTLGFKTGATGNNKRWGVTVGGTQINTSSNTANAASWRGAVEIQRVDATHINVFVTNSSLPSTASSLNLLVSDLTANTLAIVVTGSSPTTGAANDVVLYSGVAELR